VVGVVEMREKRPALARGPMNYAAYCTYDITTQHLKCDSKPRDFCSTCVRVKFPCLCVKEGLPQRLFANLHSIHGP
jgi:hypothetical protein